MTGATRGRPRYGLGGDTMSNAADNGICGVRRIALPVRTTRTWLVTSGARGSAAPATTAKRASAIASPNREGQTSSFRNLVDGLRQCDPDIHGRKGGPLGQRDRECGGAGGERA